MSKRHRKPTASAKKVAKITFTAAGSQRADHAGSGGRSAGARADCPLSAMPVTAQYIIRAGVLAFALGVGGRRGHHAGGGVRRADRHQFFSFVIWFVVVGFESVIRIRGKYVINGSDVVNRFVGLSGWPPRQVRRRGLCRVRLTPKPVRPPQQVTLRRQTHALGLRRVRLTPKPVRPTHQLTLRRQTEALGLRRVRAARTPARHRRAATPPHQPGRRPPKPGCPLPSPRLHPPSHRPPRCPPSNQPQRRPASKRRHPPQSRCHRRLHERRQHRKPQSPPRPRLKRMRRTVSRIRHRISRAATQRTVPGRRVRHRRTSSQRWSSRPPPPPPRPLNRAPRQKPRWSRWPAPFRPWRVLLRRPWRVLLRRERFQRRSVPRWHRRTSYPASCQMPWHRWA